MRAGIDEILYVRPAGRGWAPVDSMVKLAAYLLEADLRVVDEEARVSHLQRGSALLPRRRGERARLTVAPSPAHLSRAATKDHWLSGYEVEAAWVVDSFWTDRIARFGVEGHFDHIFIFDGDLEDEWRERTSTPCSFLPWGTDTCAVGPLEGARPTDVLRFGRQPDAYQDDERMIEAAARHGLVGRGRPPFAERREDDHAHLATVLSTTKSVLAFGNRYDSSGYTHPTREYLTARWTDSLAAGAIVVGRVPDCRASRELLWDGATLEIDPTDLEAGMATLRSRLEGWTPQVALDLHVQARKRLDWRWRLVTMLEMLERPATARLDDALGELMGSVPPR